MSYDGEALALPAATSAGGRSLLVRALRSRPGRVVASLPLVAAAMLLAGNLAILGATVLARAALPERAEPRVAGVGNFEVVDERVWRGSEPTPAGWRALAAQGVTTVVDLRAEATGSDRALLASLGLARVEVPVRDGRAPDPASVERALQAIRTSPGRVFVHCQAGVGRTGSVVAAYLVRAGQAGRVPALARSLAVGPPSLEQIAFMVGLDDDGPFRRPSWPLIALSRFLDGPRQLWGHLR